MIQIAHRGDSQQHGDNNLQSFRSAIEKKYDMIELDIQLCKTGEIVIFHDIFIKDDLVCNYTLDELINMNVEPLDAFLDMVNIRTIKVFFDLKGNENVIYTLLAIINSRYDLVDQSSIYISSFNSKFLDLVPVQFSRLNLGFTTYNQFSFLHMRMITQKCSFVCLHWTVLSHDVIERLHEEGKYVFVYTCDSDIVRRQIMKYDVDGIVTNYLLWCYEKLKR